MQHAREDRLSPTPATSSVSFSSFPIDRLGACLLRHIATGILLWIGIGIASAQDATPPSVPGGFTATAASATQINVSWNASTDNVGVTAYLLERCTGASCTNFTEIVSQSTRTFNDTGRAPSTTYRYRVRARDAANNRSAYSAIVNRATPADTTAPSVPGGLSATAISTTQINLTWSPSTDNVGVTQYLLERCQGASCTNFTQIATPTSASYNDTGRTASMTYRYRVRARDAANNRSGYSAIVAPSTLTPDTQAPTIPGALTPTIVSSTQINLTWTASTDAVGVTGYLLERCTGSSCTGFIQVATPAATPYSDVGVVASTTYRYRIRARDAANNMSGYSSIVAATTNSGTVECD